MFNINDNNTLYKWHLVSIGWYLYTYGCCTYWLLGIVSNPRKGVRRLYVGLVIRKRSMALYSAYDTAEQNCTNCSKNWISRSYEDIERYPLRRLPLWLGFTRLHLPQGDADPLDAVERRKQNADVHWKYGASGSQSHEARTNSLWRHSCQALKPGSVERDMRTSRLL